MPSTVSRSCWLRDRAPLQWRYSIGGVFLMRLRWLTSRSTIMQVSAIRAIPWVSWLNSELSTHPVT